MQVRLDEMCVKRANARRHSLQTMVALHIICLKNSVNSISCERGVKPSVRFRLFGLILVYRKQNPKKHQQNGFFCRPRNAHR